MDFPFVLSVARNLRADELRLRKKRKEHVFGESIKWLAAKSDSEDLREELNAALSKLNPEDREIITMRYGLSDGVVRRPKYIAAQLGVSRWRVQAGLRQAIPQLKKIWLEGCPESERPRK
jgi:RNA polymerase sigma factor (sigma-70 family)